MDDDAVRPIDADNHYYEPLDAFTRHLDPKHGPRTVRGRHDQRSRAPRGRRPGQPRRHQPHVQPDRQAGLPLRLLPRQPRRARTATSTCATASRSRPTTASTTARIAGHGRAGARGHLAVPDARRALRGGAQARPRGRGADLPRLQPLARRRLGPAPPGPDLRLALHPARSTSTGPSPNWSGRSTAGPARSACARPPPSRPSGPRSPCHRMFDPFWARVARGRDHRRHPRRQQRLRARTATPTTASSSRSRPYPLTLIMTSDRPPMDFFAAVLCDGLFDRFPNLRLASIENGAGYLPTLFGKLRKAHHQRPGFFSEDPVEIFRRHVWINPFWEDDVEELVDLVGVDRILFGSDWPHAEGLVHPLDYRSEIKMFDPDRAAHDPARQRRRADRAPTRLMAPSSRPLDAPVPPTAHPVALDGLRVLELGQHVAASYAAKLLADLGATVAKVEPPGGDRLRACGPHGPDTVRPRRRRAVPLPERQQAQRRRRPGRRRPGRSASASSPTAADVLVENLRPGALESFGLAPDRLLARHPRLVVVRISNFGQDGPWRDRRGLRPDAPGRDRVGPAAAHARERPDARPRPARSSTPAGCSPPARRWPATRPGRPQRRRARSSTSRCSRCCCSRSARPTCWRRCSATLGSRSPTGSSANPGFAARPTGSSASAR